MGGHHDFHHYQRHGYDNGIQTAIVAGGTPNAFQDEVYPPPMQVVQNPGVVSPYPDTDARVYSSPAIARSAEVPMQAVPAPAPADYRGNVVQPRYMAPPTDYRSYPLEPPVSTDPFHRHHHFFGINIGIAKLGVTDEGSINAGVNLGIVRAEAKVGLENSVRAGVNLGPIVQADAGVAAGINRNGLHADVVGGVQALTVAGGDVEAGTRLGSPTGGHLQGGVWVGPAEARGGTYTYLSRNGIDHATGGSVVLGDAAAVYGGTRTTLNNYDSRTSVGGGAQLGNLSTNGEVGIYSDGNRTVRPDLYIDGQAGPSRGAFELNPPRMAAVPPPVSRDAIYVQPLPAPERVSGVYSPPRDLPAAPLPAPQELGAYRAANPPVAQPREHARVVEHRCPPEQLSRQATPENIHRVEIAMRQKAVDDSIVIGHKGQTYLDIMSQLRPDAERSGLDSEAGYIARLNHNRPIREGSKIATLNPEEIDWETRKAVAKHFGWPPPRG